MTGISGLEQGAKLVGRGTGRRVILVNGSDDRPGEEILSRIAR
jgi:hypothetical protein